MTKHLPVSMPWLLALLVAGWIWLDNRPTSTAAEQAVAVDVVCRMEVATAVSRSAEWQEGTFWFCSEPCQQRFQAAPELWAGERCLPCASEGVTTPVGADHPAVEHQGTVYHACSVEHARAFAADPPAYLMHRMLGIPRWMFQVGVGFLLVVSFGLFELLARWRERRARDGRPDALAEGMDERWRLTDVPGVMRLLRWRGTRVIAQGTFVLCFVFVIAAGLFGDQDPGNNLAPVLTWTVWWGGLVVAILFVGKAWCYVCPWDGLASWIDRLGGPRGLGLGLKWPRLLRNIWPATVLFLGLTWLDIVLGVTTVPRATAWLGLLMFVLALGCTLLFDRKAFCRYGCLVGRVSGLYALFSGIEVRSGDDRTCASCRTMDCFRGNERGRGCPTFEFPRTMDANTYCISCMECLKTCKQGNVELRVRPWGTDLVRGRKPRADEASLCLLMLSVTVLHGLTMTPAWEELTGWLEGLSGMPHVLATTTCMVAILVAPVLIYWVMVHVSLPFAPELGARRLFLEYSYGLLPIALFYHLAHNAEHLLMEGPKVVAYLSDPFGRGWDLFGTAELAMAPLVTLEGLWGVQVLLVIVGHLYGLWISDRITRRLFPAGPKAFWGQVPMLAAMVAFSAVSLWLLKQPMEMRISAM